MGDDDGLRQITVTPRYQEGTLTDGVIVPIFQALITSAIIAMLALLIAIIAKASFAICAYAFFGAFLVALLACWLSYRGHWMYIIESILLKDINQDGYVGEPEAPRNPSLDIVLHSPDRLHEMTHTIPYVERLPTLLSGLANGMNFTFEQWAGKGKLFSQPEWTKLVAALIGANLIKQKNPRTPNSGYEMTNEGKQVFAEMLARGRGLAVVPPIPGEAPAQVYGFDTEVPPLPSSKCVLRKNTFPPQ